MYFDVTREELLELLVSYEKEASLRSLAIKAGISYAALVDFKRGKSHLLGDKNLRAVMGVLRPQSVQESRTVPIVGYVGAGADVFPIDDHVKGQGIGEADIPPFDHQMNINKTVAVEVRGNSMEPLFFEGFKLFYSERVTGVAYEFVGAICIVWLYDGRCLVKKIRQGSKAGYYTLDSINPNDPPIKDVAVQWSAYVECWKQR